MANPMESESAERRAQEYDDPLFDIEEWLLHELLRAEEAGEKSVIMNLSFFADPIEMKNESK